MKTLISSFHRPISGLLLPLFAALLATCLPTLAQAKGWTGIASTKFLRSLPSPRGIFVKPTVETKTPPHPLSDGCPPCQGIEPDTGECAPIPDCDPAAPQLVEQMHLFAVGQNGNLIHWNWNTTPDGRMGASASSHVIAEISSPTDNSVTRYWFAGLPAVVSQGSRNSLHIVSKTEGGNFIAFSCLADGFGAGVNDYHCGLDVFWYPDTDENNPSLSMNETGDYPKFYLSFPNYHATFNHFSFEIDGFVQPYRTEGRYNDLAVGGWWWASENYAEERESFQVVQDGHMTPGCGYTWYSSTGVAFGDKNYFFARDDDWFHGHLRFYSISPSSWKCDSFYHDFPQSTGPHGLGSSPSAVVNEWKHTIDIFGKEHAGGDQPILWRMHPDDSGGGTLDASVEIASHSLDYPQSQRIGVTVYKNGQPDGRIYVAYRINDRQIGYTEIRGATDAKTPGVIATGLDTAPRVAPAVITDSRDNVHIFAVLGSGNGRYIEHYFKKVWDQFWQYESLRPPAGNPLTANDELAAPVAVTSSSPQS